MRSLQEAFELFCEAHEVKFSEKQKLAPLWTKYLRPYGRAGVKALESLALTEHPYRPRLPRVICEAERIICPPVDPILIWKATLAEARRSGPLADNLHPAVLGALEYVGVERLRGGESVAFLKGEVDRYVAHYNARPFAERALEEGRATKEQLATLPTVASQWGLA